MNWLAHILLSKQHVEYQLGNLLADPFKGRLWPQASEHLRDGVQMHQAIDVYTDSHSQFLYCKRRLGPNGYLKAVVLDLLFDHFLSRYWDQYCRLALVPFIERFYDQAQAVINAYPIDQRRFINNVINADVLYSYREFSGFVEATRHIDKRLSDRVKRKDSASRYVPIVEQNYQDLSADFEVFFPQLMGFFKNHELGHQTNHYLVDIED